MTIQRTNQRTPRELTDGSSLSPSCRRQADAGETPWSPERNGALSSLPAPQRTAPGLAHFRLAAAGGAWSCSLPPGRSGRRLVLLTSVCAAAGGAWSCSLPPAPQRAAPGLAHFRLAAADSAPGCDRLTMRSSRMTRPPQNWTPTLARQPAASGWDDKLSHFAEPRAPVPRPPSSRAEYCHTPIWRPEW